MPEEEEERNRRLNLSRGPMHFNRASWDRDSRSLVLSWGADTAVENVFYLRIVTIGLRWPPVRWVSGFHVEEEPEEEGDDDPA